MTIKLTCIGSGGADLPTEFLDRSGNTAESRFDVTVGDVYTARAIAVWTYGVGVLIVDDTGRPNWKPIGLFVVSDGRVQPDWELAIVSRDPLVALLGYQSLIHDPAHHDDLIERKVAALDTFLRESGADDDPRLAFP
jgi:hypothetical protein